LVAVLAAPPGPPRLLGDPTTNAEKRTALVQQLFGGQVAPSTVQVVSDAVALRWSTPWDLLDALEICADDGLLDAAEQDNALDDVEDDLFRFERILDGDSRLTTLLDDYAAPPERRAALVTQLVEGKVHPVSARLLAHAVASQRKRSITHSIDDLLELADRRRNRSTARVVSAVPLTAAQERHLAEALTALYGRPISVRSAVEPSVRGGLVVRLGDEIIDGSVATRLLNARTALAS
jgi:F-type H+-transporting ATPase subunit delta